MPLGEEKNGTCDRYDYDINLCPCSLLYVSSVYVIQLLLFFCKYFIFFTQPKALYSVLGR